MRCSAGGHAVRMTALDDGSKKISVVTVVITTDTTDSLDLNGDYNQGSRWNIINLESLLLVCLTLSVQII